MSNKIILKKSAVPGKSPTSENLELGELAINVADGIIYFKDSEGTIEKVEKTQRAKQFFFGSM